MGKTTGPSTPEPKKDYVLEAPEEVLSTMHKDGTRRWMYPKLSKGKLYRARLIVAWVLIFVYMLLPVIHINGRPAVLLDIVHRRFNILGFEFFATDTFLLMASSFILITLIVIFTALFGRVWCGWACPQTVYLEFLYRPIERLLEGKESARKKRDKAPMTHATFALKTVKYTIFTAIALVLAHTFVAYFTGWEQLLVWMQRSPAEHPGFFLMMGVTTGLIVFDFGYFREQMCTLACPYARIQSVLMDRDSLIVSYDPNRGETRGRRNRKQREQEKAGVRLVNLGDCIDCGACVRTCPTGIDIRDGLQMECISCTQCIDACDAIMIGVGKEPGLIRYTSENALEDKPSRILRPRLGLYAFVLAIMIGLFTFGVGMTQGLDIDVIRSTGAPFIRLPNGDVSNRFKIRIQNRTGEDRNIKTQVLEPRGAKLRFVGRPTMTLKPNELKRLEVWLVTPSTSFKGGKTDAKLKIGDGTELDQEVTVPLLGPASNTNTSNTPRS